MKEVYRHAASLLLLRSAVHRGGDADYELLLLHKPRKRDAWQLPQGGMEEGETPKECALRELQEEAGMTDVEVFGASTQAYQYDFPASYRRFRPDNVRGQHISYVFALTAPETAVHVDHSEIDAYRWIRPSELPQFVKRKEYLLLLERLLAEALASLAARS